MANKTLNARIVQKHDTQVNWEKATGFIPKAGEIIIYDADENYSYPRIKVGDGENYINQLPFIDEQGNFFVNLYSDDGNNFTASKPYEEITEAFLKHKAIYAIVMDSIVLPLNQWTPDQIVFGGLVNDSGAAGVLGIYMSPDNTATANIVAIPAIDQTLTNDGYAADARIVGETFGDINEKLAKKLEVQLVGSTLKLFNSKE